MPFWLVPVYQRAIGQITVGRCVSYVKSQAIRIQRFGLSGGDFPIGRAQKLIERGAGLLVAQDPPPFLIPSRGFRVVDHNENLMPAGEICRLKQRHFPIVDDGSDGSHGILIIANTGHAAMSSLLS